MIRNLLYRLSSRRPLRIISEGERPYLERYYVGTAFGIRVYLHRFVGSDPDRGLHDHPWAWAASFILAGRYNEERRDGMHRVRWFNFLVGDNFHRVILPPGGLDVWTVFVHRVGRSKPWGFLRPTQSEGVSMYHGHTPQIADDWWRSVPLGRDEPRRMPA